MDDNDQRMAEIREHRPEIWLRDLKTALDDYTKLARRLDEVTAERDAISDRWKSALESVQRVMAERDSFESRLILRRRERDQARELLKQTQEKLATLKHAVRVRNCHKDWPALDHITQATDSAWSGEEMGDELGQTLVMLSVAETRIIMLESRLTLTKHALKKFGLHRCPTGGTYACDCGLTKAIEDASANG